jgi:hypothetical protein
MGTVILTWVRVFSKVADNSESAMKAVRLVTRQSSRFKAKSPVKA